MKSPLLDKKVIAWALYDWANSAFATTVMVVFFPLFFKQYLTAGQDATTSTFWLAMPNGISSFVLAVMAPWLGALADKGSAHLRFLAAFTAIGVLPTAVLAFVGPIDWVSAAVLFAIASLGLLGRVDFLRFDVAAGCTARTNRLGVRVRLCARISRRAVCCSSINVLMYVEARDVRPRERRRRRFAHRSSPWRSGG